MESKYETWSNPVKPWKTKVLKLYPDQANNEYCELHIVFCFFLSQSLSRDDLCRGNEKMIMPIQPHLYQLSLS